VWADVPAPPANQNIGMFDGALGNVAEADCRLCHSSGVPDRHHLLYGQPIPDGSIVPYPDADNDGVADTTYTCINCHDAHFTVERNCTVCHNGASPHHQTTAANDRHCSACHGDLVNEWDDGHYIPAYAPSLVTPTRSEGNGEPLNSRQNGAGACNYCHDDDGLTEPVILNNHDLHHGTNLADFDSKCVWCHDFDAPFEQQIRVCESCHGPESLHNIQADSPNPDNPGGIVVGGEDVGYGHVGRDAGPGDSDCWGCHGFPSGVAVALAPYSGPIVPTVYDADRTVVGSGTDTAIHLTGSSFANVANGVEYQSRVTLTAVDGTATTLTPDAVLDGTLTVTIPGDMPPGNYGLQAVKADAASNPMVISVTPAVTIARAGTTANGSVSIVGSGFGGYQDGSGTSVTGTVITGKGTGRTTTTVAGTIVSWSDTRIEVDFGARPSDVVVNSVFGVAASEISAGKQARVRGPRR